MSLAKKIIKTATPPVVLDPLLISVDDICELLNIARRQYYCLARVGKIGPRPIRIDARPRFVYEEVIAWTNHGCPNDWQWQQLIQSKKSLQKFGRKA